MKEIGVGFLLIVKIYKDIYVAIRCVLSSDS